MASFGRFLFAGVGVLVVVALGAAGAAYAFDAASQRATSCAPLPAFDAAHESLRATEARRERTLDTSMPLPPAQRGRVAVCLANGDITLVPSRDHVVRVTFTIDAQGWRADEAVARSVVASRALVESDELVVRATHGVEGVRVPWVSPLGSPAHVRIELPESTTWSLDLRTGVGDITLQGLALGGGDARVTAGAIDVNARAASGSLWLETVGGAVTLRAEGTGALRVDARSGAGDVRVELPLAAADVGYDLAATSGRAGVPRIDVPWTKAIAAETGTGARAAVRSDGLGEMPVHVVVDAQSTLGDTTITAS